MSKVINTIFGIGIAIILVLVITLGVRVFYPEPELPGYPDYGSANYDQEVADYQQAYESYYDTAAERGGRLFFVYNILGIILVIVGMLLLSMINVSSGVIVAGVWLIIWGFLAGWTGTSDIWKFVMGVVVAALFISMAVMVNRRIKHKKGLIA